MATLENTMAFLDNSPSPFHAVDSAVHLLNSVGFIRLQEGSAWNLTPGGKYYVTRNQSSLIAFRLPKEHLTAWRMTAAHSDVPTFAIKGDRLDGDQHYVRLSAEGYGGMIHYTWMDRPLTVAGRIIIRTESGVESRLVYLDQDLLTMPSLAIHQQREVNKGHEFNGQKELQPLYGLTGGMSLTALLAEEAGVKESAILGRDLFLCPRQKATRIGVNGELFQSPRIDDLACAYATLEGFLQAKGSANLGQIYCLFDNEEVGSGTRQGAKSTLLPDVLERVGGALGLTGEERRMALAHSMLLSADNGHAVHPNFPEKADPANRVYPNGGVVVKYSANQKYTTNGVTAGLFRAICEDAGVPVQIFANRADEAGGSTLGNLLTQLVSIPMVDIGMAQLAMHAAVETAGSEDPAHMARACQAFFEKQFTQTVDGDYTF